MTIAPRDDLRVARRMLVELLGEYKDTQIKDIHKLTDAEKTFLIGSCASTVLLFQICYIAGFDEDVARAGWEALKRDADGKIKTICNGQGLGRVEH